ncbi:hypothetical protein D3C86_1356370 [compost metagenome]
MKRDDTNTNPQRRSNVRENQPSNSQSDGCPDNPVQTAFPDVIAIYALQNCQTGNRNPIRIIKVEKLTNKHRDQHTNPDDKGFYEIDIRIDIKSGNAFI